MTLEPTEMDRKIMRELVRDARISHVLLSERVGLSPTACARRLQQLEQSVPEVVAKLNSAAGRINDLLNDNNRRALSHVLANLDETTGTIARRSADIDAAIANANEAAARFNEASKGLGPAVDQADLTLRKYGKVADDADAFINGEGLAQLSDLIGEMRRLVANMDHFSDQLNRQPTKLLFGDRRKGYQPK